MTALMLAAEDGREQTVKCLLRLGAQVDARNEAGRTALHAACRCGRRTGEASSYALMPPLACI